MTTRIQALSAMVVMSLLVAVWPGQAQPNTETFSFTNGTAVPDADWSGLADAWTISVMNLTSPIISEVKVTLEVAGGFNGDLYAYLTHGDGYAVLLNRVGRESGNLFGNADAGFSITLSDGGSAGDIHMYPYNGGSLLSGLNWQPDGRDVSPTLVLDTDGRTALLGSFVGENANGVWTLFLADLGAGQQSTLTSWSVEITMIPEPGTWTLALMGGLVVVGAHRRRFMRGS